MSFYEKLPGFVLTQKPLPKTGLRTIGVAYREFADVESWNPVEDDEEWEPPEVDLTLLAIVGIKVL